MSLRPIVALVCAFSLGALVACGTGSSGDSLPYDTNEPKIEQDVNRSVVRASFTSWAAGTGSPFDLLAPGATWTITGDSPQFSKTYTRDQFMAEVIDPFNARMLSPLVPDLQRIDSEGDIVTVRFFGSAITRDHETYRNTYEWQLRMRDEQIVEAVATFDLKALEELWARVPPRH